MAKKLTEKDTKAVILKEYERVLGELQKQKEETFDPKKEKNEIEKKDKIEKVEKWNNIDNKMADRLKGLEIEYNDLKNVLNEYKDIKDAIEIKKEEIEGLYRIEVLADSLIALQETIKQARNDFETSKKIEEEKLDNELNNKKIEIKNLKDLYEIEMNTKFQEMKKEQKRIKEEFEYDFKRYKTQKEDELKDYEVEKLKTLQDKETELVKKEKEANELAESLISQKQSIEEETKKKIEKVKSEISKSYENKISILTLEKDSEINLLKNKMDDLSINLESARKKETILEDKIEKAYLKLEELSSKVVQGRNDNSDVLREIKNLKVT